MPSPAKVQADMSPVTSPSNTSTILPHQNDYTEDLYAAK